MDSWRRLRCYPWGSLVHWSIVLGLVTISTSRGCSWLRGVVLFLEVLFFSKVAPTEKCEPASCFGEPGRLNFVVRWLLIFKFHRVFSSYVFIPAFAQEDQFH